MSKLKVMLGLPVLALVLTISTTTYADSKLKGFAQKGAYVEGSSVMITALDQNMNPREAKTSSAAVLNNKGRYKFNGIPWRGWTEIKVNGLYFNELTGVFSDTPMELKAISHLKRYRRTRANVNIFTHLAVQRMQQRVLDGENRRKAWRKTQREIKQFFGLKRVNVRRGGLNALNLNQGRGWYRKDNAVLLLFTGGFLSAGGDSQMLQRLSDDFSDDGIFNGIGLTDFNTIARRAADPELINTLAENIKASGIRNPPDANDLVELPDWVISSNEDTTPPVITLLGENPVEVMQNESYFDAGATAVDDQDGDVDVMTSGNVDSSQVGTYSITYTATDSANNTAEEIRIVNVVLALDTTPPIITVNGGDVTTALNNTYEDMGATATDDRDGEVEVVVSGAVNTSVEGIYIITYTATDAADNTAEAFRSVTVEADSGAPRLVADRSLATIMVDGVEKSIVFAVSSASNEVTFYRQNNELSVDMTRGNQGGITTNWSLSDFEFARKRSLQGRPGSQSCRPTGSSPYLNYIEDDVSIDSETGALTVKIPAGRHKVRSLSFKVKASNGEGDSTMGISVYFEIPYSDGCSMN